MQSWEITSIRPYGKKVWIKKTLVLCERKSAVGQRHAHEVRLVIKQALDINGDFIFILFFSFVLFIVLTLVVVGKVCDL